MVALQRRGENSSSESKRRDRWKNRDRSLFVVAQHPLEGGHVCQNMSTGFVYLLASSLSSSEERVLLIVLRKASLSLVCLFAQLARIETNERRSVVDLTN